LIEFLITFFVTIALYFRFRDRGGWMSKGWIWVLIAVASWVVLFMLLPLLFVSIIEAI